MHRGKTLKIAFVVIFIVILGATWGALSATEFSSKTKLTTIPPEDKELFLSQFRNLLRADFGFTLVGVKPLSFDEFFDYEMNRDLRKKQKFIQYLQLLFKNSSRFTLRILDEGDNCSAFLIDRRAFQQLGEDPDRIPQFETVKIGKLFGYGEGNAHFYLRRIALGKYLKKIPFVWLIPMPQRDLFTPLYEKTLRELCAVTIPFAIQRPEVDPQFHSLEEEWKWIRRNEHPYEEWDKPPFWVRKPIFISKKGLETERILKNFDNGANALGALLHDDQWFDRVLDIIDNG